MLFCGVKKLGTGCISAGVIVCGTVGFNIKGTSVQEDDAMLFKFRKCGNACISIGTGGVCASYGIGIKGFNIQ